MQFPDKLKAALRYVVSSYPESSRLGDIRLNKVLWKADVHMYVLTGKSITGWRYMKFPHGPKLEAYGALLDTLENDGLVRINRNIAGAMSEIHLTEAGASDFDLLSDREKILLDSFLQYAMGMSEAEISEETHDLFYQMTQDREEIPMGPVAEDPTEEDIKWAEAALKRFEDECVSA